MKRKLWWIADDYAEAEEWKKRYESNAVAVEIMPQRAFEEQRDVILTLEERDAQRALGFIPYPNEWMEEA